MIAVAGEALIDLIVDPGCGTDARPGGGPFNVARTIGRLGLRPAFLGRLSADSFGKRLRAALASDGVTAAIPEPVPEPTTLAVVDVNAAGAARYRFYLAGTSACGLTHPVLAGALPAGLTAFHAGSLGLVAEPAAASIEQLIGYDLGPGVLLMIDPNCRPEAITDHQAYRDRIHRILRRADVVKVSTEDLAYLCPEAPAPAGAASLLDRGPSLVLLTDGPRPARAFLPGRVLTAAVPAVPVADTIGAGDAFGGAFLAWWTGNQLTRAELGQPELVRDGLRAAVEAAVLTCTRPGAQPPWAAELAGRPGWQWLAASQRSGE